VSVLILSLMSLRSSRVSSHGVVALISGVGDHSVSTSSHAVG